MATEHEGRNSQRHGHESFPCDKASWALSRRSVRQVSHTVVFEDEESFFTMNKNIGDVNWLREEDGDYVLDAWIPTSTARIQ